MSDSRYVKVQGGREHELFASLLDRAHKAGLRSIESKLHTAPTKENGEMAIVHVRVTMESGQVFEAWGDASPKNTKIRPVAMAETRGKGRCLRDALNIGSNEFEDLEGTEPLKTPLQAVRSEPRASGGQQDSHSDSTANAEDEYDPDIAPEDLYSHLDTEHRELFDEIVDIARELNHTDQFIAMKINKILDAEIEDLEGHVKTMRENLIRKHQNLRGAAKS